MGRNLTVVQQILIDVLRHPEVERLREPMCPEPDVGSVGIILDIGISRDAAF